MNMKKSIIIVAAMLLSLSNVCAQQRGGGRQQMSVEEQVSNLKKELSLTDEQKTSFQKIKTQGRGGAGRRQRQN